jgi:hypothetical protein
MTINYKLHACILQASDTPNPESKLAEQAIHSGFNWVLTSQKRQKIIVLHLVPNKLISAILTFHLGNISTLRLYGTTSLSIID